MAEILLKELINSTIAISQEAGEPVRREIARRIRNKESIIVNFEGIEDLTTAFLNKAIGNLYNEFSKSEIDMYFRYKGLDPVDQFLFDEVIDLALLSKSEKEQISEEVKKTMRGE